ncbi:MAG TPA: hypothetical protein DCE71_08325 [Parachlamydiales bacterium]|nr:hypothetical protein [Parachlamydiales bacterium]
MKGSFLKRTRRYFSGYFTQLIVFLLLLFIFRPYNWSTASIAIWEAFFSGVFFSAIFNANHPKPIKILTMVLGVPALALDWTALFIPWKSLIISSLIFTIIFLTVCTASILYNVVLRAKVTMETLRGVVCAYFMIAFIFGFIYLVLEFIFPGSFQFIYNDKNYTLHSSYLSQTFYFSFITLLTIGFGDITPITDLSQSFVVIEGIIGQFYVAILVARIVSVYVLFGDKAMLKHIEQDIRQDIKDAVEKVRKQKT